jgi:hypothetical protein
MYIIVFLLCLIPLIIFFHTFNDWRKCPKGGYHKWQYKEDLKVADGWLSDMLLSIKGNNIYSDNQRHVCKKCGLVEKLKPRRK